MALELFKPFIMSRLVERKSVQNIKAAKKYVDSMTPEVWDVLEEVIAEHPVLLNRAPTLHRLGIQAFEPVLVEGKAIQVHPLVCHAFNADFDGDQMAVHLPLSAEAQAEARHPDAVVEQHPLAGLRAPARDADAGHGARLYYLTYSPHDLERRSSRREARSRGRSGSAPRRTSSSRSRRAGAGRPPGADRVRLGRRAAADHAGPRDLQRGGRPRARASRSTLEDAVGHEFINHTLGEAGDRATSSPSSSTATARPRSRPCSTRSRRSASRTRRRAGITISKNDIVIPPEKEEILAGYEGEVAKVEDQYDRGLITEEERHETIVNIWTEATDEVADAMEENLDELNPIFMMANSGARGSFKQIRQLAGMRGLMANPKGEIIERPIKANFMEGLSVLEYFISTHGARKGLADTALRTADSGYLTRRLVDVSQDVIIREDDCGTEGLHRAAARRRRRGAEQVAARAASSRRTCTSRRKDGKPGAKVLLEKGDEITNDAARASSRSARRGARTRAPRALGAQVPQRVRRLPDLLRHLPRRRARSARSATRSGSSPRSRSASRARS